MPRQDIFMDAVYGEVETTDNLTNKVIYDFVMQERIEGEDNDNFLYGDIFVQQGFEKKYNHNGGIHIRIPYTASYKQLKVRLRTDNPVGDTTYVVNRNTNGHWIPVFKETEDGWTFPLHLSELETINENGNFNLLFRGSYMALFSGEETDLEFKAALNQNEIFLLKALAGNIYQYPTTGVGLIEFLHGNFENAGLAAKIQSEFTADRMIVNNAYMNSETGELYLDVMEKDG